MIRPTLSFSASISSVQSPHQIESLPEQIVYWLVVSVGIIHVEGTPVFPLVIGYIGYLIIYIGRNIDFLIPGQQGTVPVKSFIEWAIEPYSGSWGD